MAIYNDEKTYEIAEMIDKRTIKNFLRIIKIKKPNFVDNQMLLLIKQIVENVDVYSLIEEFRQFVRLYQSIEKFINVTHFAFAVNQNKQLNEKSQLQQFSSFPKQQSNQSEIIFNNQK